MKIRFLVDENLSHRLVTAVKRHDKRIDIIRVGGEGAPALGTPDAAILHYLAATQRVLVTENRSTIPSHLHTHYSTGGASHWGILWVRPNTTAGQLAVALHLIWEASDAEEWLDRTEWIPF